MTCFWAVFEQIDGCVFRFDTRIYTQPVKNPSANDKCIGAVVGMNPGSAKPTNYKSKALQRIDLGYDKTLPILKNIFSKAYNVNGRTEKNEYIQVLNLFYMCNKNATEAKKEIQKYSLEKYLCYSEKNKFAFIFYSWGLQKGLDDYKTRFLRSDGDLTTNHIWLDKNSNKVNLSKPNINDKVKHPLGLTHKVLLPKLSEMLNKLEFLEHE